MRRKFYGWLAQSSKGRVVLHLIAIATMLQFKSHIAGIIREF